MITELSKLIELCLTNILSSSEYRVTKMYKIEPVAKGQFFEDSSGILWNGEEEEEYEEEVLTPTDDNLSGGNGSVDNLDAASSQKSGRSKFVWSCRYFFKCSDLWNLHFF